ECNVFQHRLGNPFDLNTVGGCSDVDVVQLNCREPRGQCVHFYFKLPASLATHMLCLPQHIPAQCRMDHMHPYIFEADVLATTPSGTSGFEADTDIGTFKYTVVNVYVLRSEEHTSELQSRENLVCRLL